MAAAFLAGLSICLAAGPIYAASADPPPGGGIVVTPGGPTDDGTVGIGVTQPGAPGGAGSARPGQGGGTTEAGGSGGQAIGANCDQACITQQGICAQVAAQVPPPTAGMTGEEANQYLAGIGCAPGAAAAGGGPAPPPPPTPAQLAAKAYGLLVLLDPTAGRSPAGRLSDGTPYVVVRVPTWFYTDPATWTASSKTVRAGAVWATATATPTVLSFSPGDGGATVRCVGPGRSRQSADEQWSHAPGGCDYSYPRSTYYAAGHELTATYGITWHIRWVGSGGAAGALNDQTTTSTATFAVAEAETVVIR